MPRITLLVSVEIDEGQLKASNYFAPGDDPNQTVAEEVLSNLESVDYVTAVAVDRYLVPALRRHVEAPRTMDRIISIRRAASALVAWLELQECDE